MERYHKVLVVSNELTEERAAKLRLSLKQQHYKASDIQMIYVVPSIPAQYFHMPAMLLQEKQMQRQGKQHLAKMAKLLGISAEQCTLREGKLHLETRRLAKQLQAKVIDVDSNVPQQGWQSLKNHIVHWLHLPSDHSVGHAA